ncbi:MAG: hypothetical protein AB1726_01650 [Planctomycetota bacterium]
MVWGLFLGLALLSGRPAQDAAPAVRFVRIELPGERRVLSLAEVQVLRNGRNLALAGAASQSSTDFAGAAGRAIDGNWDGTYENASVTHTREETDPWWELDLGEAQCIDQITLWPRTDSSWDRLASFRLLLLDDARTVLWKVEGQSAPRTRRDFTPWGGEIVRPRPDAPLRERRQAAIDTAIDRGVEWLLAGQQRDGSWGDSSDAHGSGQTGLSLYALLKSGVPRTAPAVVRGFAYLRSSPPPSTYAVACALMAYGALGEEGDRAAMEQLVAALTDWQSGEDSLGRRNGTWAYPDGAADLSNTQFAVLGLRAAALVGVEVPKRAWLEALGGVLDHQEPPHEVDVPPRDGRSASLRRSVAGFRYHTYEGRATGSMTAAGLSSIAICEWGLGERLPKKERDAAGLAKRLAQAWLEVHFQVGSNPEMEPESTWHDYYLYGLERVGALLGLDLLGDHDWYWEGAGNFLGRQEGAGNWGGEAGTCFALLFLGKATAAMSGAGARHRESACIAEDEGSDVRWRVTGRNPVAMFITGFSPRVLADYTDPAAPVKGLRVERVEYLAGGEVIGTLPGDPGRGWTGERYALQHRFERGGTAYLEVRVHVVDPHATAAALATVVLIADGLDVELGEVLEEWMLLYPAQGARNLLRRTPVRASASSELDPGRSPARAMDGLHATAWIAARDDAQPALRLDFDRPVRADRILFSPVSRNARDRRSFDVATRVEVLVNGRKESYAVDLPADERGKGELVLPKPANLRQLEIRILERAPGALHPGEVGFAEVEILLGS